MNGPHAAAEVGHFEAAAGEDVGVTPAAGGPRADLAPKVRRRLHHQPDDRRVVAELERLVATVDARLDPSRMLASFDGHAVAGGRLVEAAAHVLALGVELGEVAAPRLALHHHAVRHDVGREPSLDHAEVGRGLLVEAAQAHGRDGLAGDLDRADALLRADAGVGLEAVDDEAHVIGRRRARDQLVHAVAVEHQPAPRRQACDVEVLGAEQAILFADREQDLDGAVGQSTLTRDADRFENGDDPRLVVAAEDGGAVGLDHVALRDGPDVLAGHHGVHVGAQQERRGRRCGSRNTGEDVAGVGADLAAGVVHFHLRAERFQRGDETPGHRRLAARGTGDLHQLHELRHHALAIDHAVSLKKRSNHSRLAATAARRWLMSVSR